ncbi:MAG: beta-N-acetylhexosaminidase [Rhodospirillaceae bacterium]|mgnify:CR=1 FL=1|nr:beta-N-acetylhexosaminidase [Rhodospirillaceae bacterium]
MAESDAAQTRATALIVGCTGPVLSDDEHSFFRDADPLGFILFQRNCETPDQIRALVTTFRDAVGRSNAPVLIDQEGGRVQRLRPPHWRDAPPAKAFADLYRNAPEIAREGAFLNALLIGRDLADLGITVDCAPVADVPQPDAHDIIGDRAYGLEPTSVAELGRAVCEGLMAAGVLPVIKHMPGHGRAMADSHLELPVVDAPIDQLRTVDFPPFKDLADMPWAMTAHVIYSALDADDAATNSTSVIGDVIRSELGFDGVLVSDDLGMKALEGDFGTRARRALAAGCDVALHCSGDMDEMIAAAAGAGPLTVATEARIERTENERLAAGPSPVLSEAALTRLEELLA